MTVTARISGATTKRFSSQGAVVRIPRLVLASKSKSATLVATYYFHIQCRCRSRLR